MNHLYWTAASTPDGNPAVMEAKWRSLVNHIQDIHDHDTPAFSSCAHGPLDEDQRNKEWLDPGTVLVLCTLYIVLFYLLSLSNCLDALTCDLCDEIIFSFPGNLITFCLLFMFAIIHMQDNFMCFHFKKEFCLSIFLSICTFSVCVSVCLPAYLSWSFQAHWQQSSWRT